MDPAKQPRIFVVDQPAGERERVVSALKDVGAVVEWDRGEPFLQAMLRNEAPDLALVAADLPDLSGLDLCRRIALDPVARRTPIVLLSERTDEGFVRAAIDAGAIDVVGKPVSAALLQTRLRSYLTLPHGAEEPTVESRTRSEELERLVDSIRGELAERERTMARAEFLFSHDLVTGLPNRRHLMELLERALRRVEADGQPIALIGFEIEQYTAIQSSLEADAFDRLVAAAAVCIQQALRPLDVVARLGDDLFAGVLVPRAIDTPEGAAANAREAAARAARALHEDLIVDGRTRPLQVRTAIAVFPTDGSRASDLLRHVEATLALAHGGQRRRSSPTPELAAAQEMELRLRQAIDDDRLVPYYQPKVDTVTRRVVGAEALMRWPLRGGEFVGPQEFVPVAETGGLVPQLDDYMLTAACCQIAEWQGRFPAFRVAVNLSALKLHHRGILERVRELLAMTGAKAEHLELEITESALITDFDAARVWLGQVREMGVTVALDDFGTGYSSLAYLRRLPLDAIKIDRSFVMALEHEASTVAIVRAMLAMAKALGLQTIAEGVETLGQAEILAQLGCGTLQGFLFSPAVPAEEFAAALEAGLIHPRFESPRQART